ncbi:DUF481 domain-containing protein [Microbulbifer bruguierae]|uniref:DUF481 domain-containing protein n=1 Tax=Microbulbifer bruguierae TaxID=3029061 RepID=A0ABY8NCJ7_9GAMM|nr:DUF481 domain-containing protein [Microbulbifer bruguierae]WGL16649.1 DUF481 domain-containing protein [Microbulbifer bruguierae]
MLLSVIAIFSVQHAYAGVLSLSNGDRVHGELVLVEKDHVVWKSETFGDITVDKSKILSLETDKDLKIAGRDEPCALAGHYREQWELYCDEGEGWVMDFPAIDRAEPYINFVGNPVIFNGNVSASGVFENGNRQREDWDVSANFNVRHSDFQHIVGTHYQNQNNVEVEGLEKYRLAYDLRWIFAEKWFAAGNSAFLHEDAQNIDLSTTVGLGLGYLFSDTDKSALSIQGGLSSVKDDFIDPNLSERASKRYAAGRTAWDFRYKFDLGPEVYYNQEVLQSLDRSEDYQSNAEIGVRTPLVKGVLMEVKYAWQYDNTPSLDSEKEDTKMTVGVGYAW